MPEVITQPDLTRLLSPRTIAVFGGKECERVVEQCDKLGFTGTIWPVHPTREILSDRPCFKSVDDLPDAPDAAYVAVNRERTVEIVAALAKRGAGGAVCYAAGFAEAIGEDESADDVQRRLVEAAGDMPIIGPNCYGFINALTGAALWPDQHGVRPCEGGVAIITQSSNIAINLTMQRRGLPVAMVMTAGNQAQTGLSTLAQAMLDDERVTALGMHIEGLDDVQAFEALALRARALNKPIVALKVGRSDLAQKAAMTHTASLSGSQAAHSALFKRLGIAEVTSLETLLETLKLLHVTGPVHGSEILSLSCSGGEASLMADATRDTCLTYRPFTQDQTQQIKSVLGDKVTVANPFDYNTYIWGDWPGMIRLFEAALAPDFDLALLVMDFPHADICDPDDWVRATKSFVAAVQQTGARAAVVSSLPETMPVDMSQWLISVGIAPLCGFDAALQAVEGAVRVGQRWKLPAPKLLLTDHFADAPQTIVLDEHASKQALVSAGLIVPKGVVATNMNEIEHAMTTLQWPLAVKALGINHKTEVGGVALNLDSTVEVITAIQRMARLTKRFLIEEMAAKPLAEIIVGVTRDPVIGLALTVGTGGVLTELLDDTATLLLPATEADVREAVSSLKTGQLLQGYRESEAADIDALIANILCIALYAARNADTLEELDVNPLLVTQFGSVAVDALIVKKQARAKESQ
ncbi:MAG: acetate--CoA ligase family protein [Pseudomonadota bacterium]